MSGRHKAWAAAVAGLLLVLGGIAAAFYLPTYLALANDDSAVPIEANFPAPDLNLTALDGREFHLSDLRGQVVLINNWATWCPPCRDEMPTLEAYYQAHRDQGFVLVAIAAHEYPFEVQNFLKQTDWQLSFLIVPDPQEQAMNAFRQTHLPASYVVDRQGIVRLMWVGAISRRRLEQTVTPLLEK